MEIEKNLFLPWIPLEKVKDVMKVMIQHYHCTQTFIDLVTKENTPGLKEKLEELTTTIQEVSWLDNPVTRVSKTRGLYMAIQWPRDAEEQELARPRVYIGVGQGEDGIGYRLKQHENANERGRRLGKPFYQNWDTFHTNFFVLFVLLDCQGLESHEVYSLETCGMIGFGCY